MAFCSASVQNRNICALLLFTQGIVGYARCLFKVKISVLSQNYDDQKMDFRRKIRRKLFRWNALQEVAGAREYELSASGSQSCGGGDSKYSNPVCGRIVPQSFVLHPSPTVDSPNSREAALQLTFDQSSTCSAAFHSHSTSPAAGRLFEPKRTFGSQN
jgi:hypothetical protein